MIELPTIELSEDQIRRYARHIVLPEVGGLGQARLAAASVLVIGAGGLGSPLLLYLAAAGIGRLGIVDDDRVDEGNLQRQLLFAQDALGRPKVDAAADRLSGLNRMVTIVRHPLRLDAGNADALVAAYDLVADGSDNLATRLAVHAACLRQRRPLVSASVQGMDGQLTTVKAYLGDPHPCLRCIWPTDAADADLPSCAQAGVLGPAAGVVGSLQAVEVVKEILGPPMPSLSGRLVLYDAIGARLEHLTVRRIADCPCCGSEAPGR